MTVRSRFLVLLVANCWVGGMCLALLIMNVMQRDYLMMLAYLVLVAASANAAWICLRYVR